MKRLINLLLLFLITVCAFAQKNDILITIGGRQFTSEEFLRIYEKNNSNLLNKEEQKSAEEYLDLFVNFKLKVIEAENLKMDTFSSFINELAGYRKELAEPYLTDINFNEELIKETYQRMKTEVKASHLLISIEDASNPEDTLKAYNKIMQIREEILNGLGFGEAAYNYSDDPSAKSNMGSLGYFSAFQMVFPFEDAAYKIPVGEISMPVRSSYGYHLIKVMDKREALGEIKAAHIMKMFPQDVDDAIMKQLRKEIDTIYSQLKAGADFAEMAKKYSDDKRSSEVGGELAWFNSGRMIPDFANPAFALEENGDISEPVMTQYGYHIIKRLGHRPVKSFDELKGEIEKRIKIDPARSIHSKEAFIRKLKSEYHFEVNEITSDNVKNNHFPIQESGNGTESLTDELFTLDGNKYTAGKFYKYILEKYPGLETFDENSFKTYFNEWVDKEVLAYEDSRLEEKYPEFKNLMEEYHDGILLFNISDEKIWSFAGNDSTGLREFYKKNKGTHIWGERFKGAIIKCDSQETRDEADKYFSAGLNAIEIIDLVNTDSEKVHIEKGAWEKNTNPVVNYYVWNGPKPEGFNEELEYIRGNLVGPEPKTLEEARGLYLSDYQNYLEEEWIKSLRKKYKIKVNKKLLKAINNASE